jgi:hypothetical protein
MPVMGQLTSENGRYYAILGGDGQFALYDGVLHAEGFGGVLWSVNNGKVAQLAFHDKALVLQTQTGAALWSVDGEGTGGRRVQVNNNGNMVLYRTANSKDFVLWSTGTGARSIINKNEKLFPHGRITSPNGQYWASLQPDGNFVVYSRRMQKSLWSTGTTSPVVKFVQFKNGRLQVCTEDKCANPVFQSKQVKDMGNSPTCVLNNEGHLVILSEEGHVLWSTKTVLAEPSLVQVKRLLGRARGLNPCASRISANFCYGHGTPTEDGLLCKCVCDKGYEGERCNTAVFKRRELVLYEGIELEALDGKTLEQCTAACIDNAKCHSFTHSDEDHSCSLRDKCVSGSEASAPDSAGYTTYFRPCGFLTESVNYQCMKGTTTNGAANGARAFSITCEDDGYSSGAPCQVVMYTISGWVNDAPTSSNLPGARVCAGSICADANKAGIYSLSLPAGSVRLTTTLQGYITQVVNFRVDADVAPYAGADVALVPVMAADAMRVVLTWNADPSDLDSHTFFGDETSMCHACWYQTTANHCARSGGVTAALERDFTSGFGPEVTFIANVGHCTNPHKNQHCRLQFKVKDYSKYYDEPVTMGDSGAIVRAYKGDSMVGEYKVPSIVGGAWWWTVFTVDLSNGDIYEGDANVEDPADAFVGPAAAWTVGYDQYRLKTPGNVELKSGDNGVVTLRPEDGASHAGWYSVRSGSKCLDKHGAFSDCPPAMEALEGVIYSERCSQQPVMVRMTYSACVATVTDTDGYTELGWFAGENYADTLPSTMGDCPMIPCAGGRFRVGGNNVCNNVVHLPSTAEACGRASGLWSNNLCVLSLCSDDNGGASSYAVADPSHCSAENSQGAFGLSAVDGNTPYVLCSGAIEKLSKDQLWQLLPLPSPSKMQMRNVGVNRCLEGTATGVTVTYCQYSDGEPLDEGRQWSRVNVPSAQSWRVFPETAGVFL